MSRAVVYDAIVNDSELNALGITSDTVFPNYANDKRPTDTGPFIIIRWESQPYLGASRLGGFGSGSGMGRGARDMTVWVHIPKEQSTDFTRIDAILDRLDDILTPLEHEAGADGYTLTCVRPTGRGGDNRDDGFDTIVRNAAYKILSRRTA